MTSAVSTALASATRRRAVRGAAELWRRIHGATHRVEYFHQVDDPYSQLAAQLLPALLASYDIELVPHLVGPPPAATAPERELLAAYARRDAADVAPGYGLAFSDPGAQPAPDALRLAQRLLAAAAQRGDFAGLAAEVGRALWAEDKLRLAELAALHAPADEGALAACLAEGDARRAKLGHYLGATFHYGREWYWGVDRLDLLETRLRELGAARPGVSAPLAPRPAIDPGPVRDDGRISLEFFPSLRSPYSAIIMRPTFELALRSGVRLVLRPVLPMVMRGVPVTFAKGSYIVFDTRREAERLGVDFGRIADPIGSPVERGFSLFPFARDRGRAEAFLLAFVQAAWAEGIDLGSDAGLRSVVERAGLPWDEARPLVGNDDWRDELERNRVTLYEELGLWGVPCYRVRGPAGVADFSTWGQDRLWRVAEEIRRRIAA